MNQCVPGWDLDENPAQPRLSTRAHSDSSTSVPAASLDYEVAELTWENGHLAMHGLGLPRVVNNKSTVTPTWDKPSSGGGTLESIVNQATHSHHKSAHNSHELVHWFNHHHAMVNHPATRGSLTMDALVPCTNNMININENLKHSAHVLDSVTRIGGIGCSTGIGSCNPFGIGDRVTRVETSGCKTNVSLSESATCGERHSHQLTLDTCELGGAFTSPEDSSGKEYSKTSADDSVCHSRSQRKLGGDDGKNKKLLGIGKSSISTKRSRAAAIHNQSERKRRDRINQRMKTLQKMVPNSNKTDKASMLDEVIEYLKQLQAQIQMMSRMSMPSMMLPLAMQQQLQMSMMGMQMGMGMGMGVMDMNNSSCAADLPPVMPSTAPFMLVPSWDNPGDRTLPATSAPPSGMHDPLSAFLAGQSQPMTMDAYSRLAAMYQQFQHNAGPGSGPKH